MSGPKRRAAGPRREIPSTAGRERPARKGPGRTAFAVLAMAVASAGPLLANGGSVRFANVPVGPYIVTIYSAPTPLRTGEVDVSALVQDSSGATVDLPIVVRARPVELPDSMDPDRAWITQPATREQATNKLFKAAKFDIDDPGDWWFRVEIADAGRLTFQAPVARTTILDRPWLLATLVLLPLGVVGWFLLGREPE